MIYLDNMLASAWHKIMDENTFYARTYVRDALSRDTMRNSAPLRLVQLLLTGLSSGYDAKDGYMEQTC